MPHSCASESGLAFSANARVSRIVRESFLTYVEGDYEIQCSSNLGADAAAGSGVLLPRIAWSQSVIAGVVTDGTGAVLPGVTVEAASPVLIEKVRTATTDAGGRYSIVDLRPGAYTVTFTLAGFSTVRREGIEVASNVNVPVNAELRVGALEETITVTGASPVVDVQQAAQRQVLNREVLDALPTSRSYLSAGAVVSGAKLSRPEMGGINVGQGAYLSARGKTSNDDAIEVDGMDMRIPRRQPVRVLTTSPWCRT